MMEDTVHPLKLFFSYAQADVRWRNRLEKHLSGLRRQNLINVWDDYKINPGSEWKQEHAAHLNAANIILLLISPDYIDSEDCYHEMQQALSMHKTGKVGVIPILLRPIHIEDAPFHILRSLPTNGVPITRWQRSDDALHDVVEGIGDVITQFNKLTLDKIFHQKEENKLKDSAFYNPQKSSVLGEQELAEGQREKLPDFEESLPQYNAARQRYLEHVYKRYTSVKLPLGPAEGFSLQAIFQPLTLHRDPSTAEDLKRNMAHVVLGESSKFISLGQSQEKQVEYKEPAAIIAENGDDALHKTPQGRMVILGGPGTGKTITLKYLVSNHASDAMADPTAPIPIFLSLTDLARSTKTLQRYLIDVVEDMGVESRYADILWKDIEGGRAFICLDSLDEMAPQHRVEMIELINLWASRAGNIWIIGSRFTEYKGGQFKQGQFAEWELLPMSHSMRLQLSERLFPELKRLIPGAKVVLSSDAFVNLLEHHPHAAAWGENPLFFSLAAVIVLQTGGLPSCRAALYHDVVEAILQTREQDPLWSNLLMRMLTRLALWLHQSKGRTFTRSDLLTFFLEVQEKSLAETTELARRTISSGIIEVVAHDTYSFRHQTFQEYLAATELACLLTDQKSQIREDGWHLAWGKHTYSRWTEVLRLMVGTLVQTRGRKGREVAQRWLRALLEQRVAKEGDPGNLGLTLAVKSLAEVSEIAGWETSNTATLEKEIITLWIDELHFVALHNREAQIENLARISRDVSHLRKPLLEHALKQVVIRSTDKHSSVIASAVLRFLGEHIPLEPLLEALNDKIPEVRTAAVQVLAQQGEHAPIEVLISTFKDKDSMVRKAAAKALEIQRERVPTEALVSMLKDWEGVAWQSALKALGVQATNMPIEVLLEILKPALKDWQNIALQIAMASRSIDKYEEEKIQGKAVLDAQGKILIQVFSELRNRQAMARQAVVEALGVRGEQVPLEIFVSALKDKSEEVREAVLSVLGSQGKRVPLEIFVSSLKDESWSVRVTAVRILGSLGERVPAESLLNTLLWTQDRLWCEEIVSALSGSGGSVPVIPLEKLVSILHNVNENVREAMVRVLGAQGERVPIEILLSILNDESRFVREAVIHVLGAQGERVPIEVFLSTLQDKNGFVREAAVKALGKQGERVPIEVFLTLLQDSDKFMRRAAAEALTDQGERVPVEALLLALKDEDKEIKEAAVKALGKQGECVPIEVFLTLLQDSDKFMRRAAAEALVGQGERVPLDILMKHLEDKDDNVRHLMIRVIRKINPEALSTISPNSLNVLQQQPIGMILSSIIQGFIVDTPDDLGRSLQFLFRTLEQLLDWPDTVVRVKAVRVLGKIRQYIPDPIIQRLLELRQDPDPTLSTVVDEALAEILSLETGIEDD